MKLISRKCYICHTWHNRPSCRVCGAIKIGDKHYDVANGRELVRANGLPSVLQQQVTPMITHNELRERIVPRLVSAAR